MSDDLLRPTIRTSAGTQRPWRVASQAYVAFFGGVLAVTLIGYLNSRRLGVPARDRRWLLVIGGAALAAELVLASVLADLITSSPLRIVIRVVALLAYFAMARLQHTPERVFQLRGGEHAKLWGPGLAAVFGCGIPELVLVAIVVVAS
ncbi:hypothetical protein [Crossiella cryophila]|uniref:Uncharacterized protein n=1 Tax=Crossiella cryophila TaxID=43355 RepID=A0A7W7FXF4_9PSEU|nr:hypothetical protein [Crossiella cryophila]MBB4678864.1 hypothetical protein [Crossiella cryophila]